MMRDDVLAVHSLDTHPKPDTAEHEFRWEADPQEFEPNPQAENNRPTSKVPTNLRLTGNTLHLALAGLIAIAIVSVFFGASFHLLAPRVTAKRTASEANVGTPSLALGDALRANIAAQPVPQESGVPKSSGPSVPSASPPVQRTVVADAPPGERREASAAPIKDPQTATEPAPASNPTQSPAQSTPSAGLPTSPPQDAAPSSAAKHHPSRSKNHEARSVSRHSHWQHAHSPGAVTPHQARQTRSFDRLVTQLTGQAEPGGATLTPPRTQEPDPFASRRAAQ